MTIVKVVIDDLWLCVDCTMIAVNDDATGIESDERVKEFGEVYLEVGDDGKIYAL